MKTQAALIRRLDDVNRNMMKYYGYSINQGLGGKIKILFIYPHKFFSNKRFRLKSKKKGSIKTKTFYGHDFYTDSEKVYSFGAMPSEINLTKFFIKNFRSDEVFYDIGANCGFYTFLANELITTGEIHAFEPSPEPFLKLKEGSNKNQSATFLNNKAVSDKVGEVFLWDSYNNFTSGSSTIIDAVVKQKGDKKGVQFEQIKVMSTTIDEYVKNHSIPTIIKIDVEGAEGLVIAGAKNLLINHSPLVTLEVWIDSLERYEVSKKSVEKIMELGYTPHEINMHGDLRVIKDISFDAVKKSKYDNWLFKKYNEPNP